SPPAYQSDRNTGATADHSSAIDLVTGSDIGERCTDADGQVIPVENQGRLKGEQGSDLQRPSFPRVIVVGPRRAIISRSASTSRSTTGPTSPVGVRGYQPAQRCAAGSLRLARIRFPRWVRTVTTSWLRP